RTMEFDMNSLMKQAQAMQERMKKAQEEIANAEVIGEAGAGMVKVIMNGRHDVREVEIDPSLLTEENAFLVDVLSAAVTDAVRRVAEHKQKAMSSLTECMPIPPGFKMF